MFSNINIRKIFSIIKNTTYIFFLKIHNTLFVRLYILYDKIKLNEFTYNKSKISFNNEILISHVKTDPFKDYTEIRELGAVSFPIIKLVINIATVMVRIKKINKKKRKIILNLMIEMN